MRVRLQRSRYVLGALLVLAATASSTVALGRDAGRPGSPVEAFAQGGLARLRLAGYSEGTGVLVQPSGRVVVAGTGDGYMDPEAKPTGRAVLIGLTRRGQLDRRFGERGEAPTPGRAIAGLASRPHGGFVAAVNLSSDPTEPATSNTLAVTGYRAGGQPDPSYGNHGTTRVPLPAGTSAIDMDTGRSGTAVVALYRQGALSLLRIGPAGHVMRTFGDRGVADTPLAAQSFSTERQLAIDRSGNVVAVGRDGRHGVAAVVRVTRAGHVDPSFGHDGVADLRGPVNTYPRAVVILRTGRIIAESQSTGLGAEARLVALRPNGHLARRFAQGGVLDLGPSGWAGLTAEPGGTLLAQRAIRGGSASALCRYTARGRRAREFGHHGCAPLPLSAGDAVNRIDANRSRIAVVGTIWDPEKSAIGVAELRSR